MSIVFSSSIASIMATAVRPVAQLHGVTADIALAWINTVDPEKIKNHGEGQFPTRYGAVTFHVGSSHNLLLVGVEIQRVMRIGESETWVGTTVSCIARSWSWTYRLDWKTNQIVEPQIKLGEYPFAHLNLSFLT